MRLAVFRLADRPHRAFKVDVASQRRDHFARAAAGEQNQRQRFADGPAVGTARQPSHERREIGIAENALYADLRRTFDALRKKHEVVRKTPLFCGVCVRTANATKQVSATTWSAIQHRPDDFVLMFAPRHSRCRALAEPADQLATQQACAFVAALRFLNFSEM